MTAREALAEAERRLAAAGVDTPRVDAELLVSHALGVSRTQLYADLDRELEGVEPLLHRRERREPLPLAAPPMGSRGRAALVQAASRCGPAGGNRPEK